MLRKGLEFDWVILGSDFTVIDEPEDAAVEVLNILYVALTRAKQAVLPSSLVQDI